MNKRCEGCKGTKVFKGARCQGLKGAKGAWVKSSEALLRGRVLSKTHFWSSLSPEEGPSCLDIVLHLQCNLWRVPGRQDDVDMRVWSWRAGDGHHGWCHEFSGDHQQRSAATIITHTHQITEHFSPVANLRIIDKLWFIFLPFIIITNTQRQYIHQWKVSS